MRTAGLLLAAGAGTRFGGPKALAEFDGGSFVDIALSALVGGGCDRVYVVVGAAAPEVSELLPDNVIPILAENWQAGLGESLRVGISALESCDAALIHLVDLPDVGAGVVARLLEYSTPNALARAAYNGKIGHPVVIGRAWWPDLVAHLSGDDGGRRFLRGRAELVECSDLATGRDIDEVGDLANFRR
ncbi:NTP transferase domain-containing protein [Antrihabitans sp. YC2-6]|uniref:nucleotidyltransferase family protein n=1 Tax=Antrihabitans sp. YC2-6 TaxID=2799498 RepID=UPI0018F2AF37|nr:nucleotidyltransferase family protein [Antrihabitans sp. YC2-6]MBJ8348925.1 nucleotidyltransferase family protein [Antrihabitans sp. YC2-6]